MALQGQLEAQAEVTVQPAEEPVAAYVAGIYCVQYLYHGLELRMIYSILNMILRCIHCSLVFMCQTL